MQSLFSAARPTTVAIEKAVSGELPDNEEAIRGFLEGKVSPAAMDNAVALVLKYIPIIRKQQASSKAKSTPSQTTPTERVLPVEGEVHPSKKSPTGVVYKDWTIDKAVRSPGTYYALFVGTNGPYSKTGFTSPQEALNWVENVGSPSTYQGFVDKDTLQTFLPIEEDEKVSFSDLSSDEKQDLIEAFKSGGFEYSDIQGLSSTQRQILREFSGSLQDLTRILNS